MDDSGESTSLAAVQEELVKCRKENDTWLRNSR